jgi:hypothetical protein
MGNFGEFSTPFMGKGLNLVAFTAYKISAIAARADWGGFSKDPKFLSPRYLGIHPIPKSPGGGVQVQNGTGINRAAWNGEKIVTSADDLRRPTGSKKICPGELSFRHLFARN